MLRGGSWGELEGGGRCTTAVEAEADDSDSDSEVV